MTDRDSTEVTRLLMDWKAGNSEARDRLFPILYDELKRLASHHLHGEAIGHSLQTTALVHEAYLRLTSGAVAWEGRRHFFAIAARVMRQVLVDHARGRGRAKRGHAVIPVPFEEELLRAGERPASLLDLDEALDRLSSLDPRKAQIIDLLYFGGMSYDETAAVLEISPATVHRDLRLARAWLYRELGPRIVNERWQRVADLFSGATALQIEDRALFLEIACGADPELRREVESLLLADATCENDRFLRTPIDEIRADLNIPADARRSDP